MFSVPLAQADALGDFAAGLGDRLTDLAGDHVGEGFMIGLQGICQGEQVLAALTQRHLAPLAKAFLGALQRRFQCGVGVEG